MDSYHPRKLGSLQNISIHSLWGTVRFRQIAVVLLLFTCIVHYFERIKPRWTIQQCQWKSWEKWPKGSEPHHSLIYGDPQIVDDFSYPHYPALLSHAVRWFSDNYLHRNHRIIGSTLEPHSILFIGDLFDGGREWEDTVWYSEYKRFNSIFDPLPEVRQFKQIPGNHDIGFGLGVNFDKYSRFRSYFGNADEYVLLGNHSVVLMDTVSLSCHNDTRVKEQSELFLNSLAEPNHPSKKYPRIVLTHVPLYRATETQTCGKFRENQKEPFPVVRGVQYQTVLEYEMSQNILNYIKPSIVFSGDDHDYCHIKHPFFNVNTPYNDLQEYGTPGVDFANEVTVKSSAMTGGIKKPAIQLISMWNPLDDGDDGFSKDWKPAGGESKVVDSKTVKTELCYLPSAYQPLAHYTINLALSILWIFVCSITGRFGARLNMTFDFYYRKVLGLLRSKLKVESNIDLMKPIKKTDDHFEYKIVKYFFLTWDCSTFTNWLDFFINSLLIVAGYGIILTVYFVSI